MQWNLSKICLRVLKLNWEIGESEQRTCTVMAEAVAGQIASLGLGRLEIAPWLADATALRSRAIDSYHHAGTTRMSADPALGVVDPDGRVHGADGLYVTGGSLFPTSGHAHPTLTIVALALRLADHLASRP